MNSININSSININKLKQTQKERSLEYKKNKENHSVKFAAFIYTYKCDLEKQIHLIGLSNSQIIIVNNITAETKETQIYLRVSTAISISYNH